MAKHCNLAESQIEDLFKATYGSILATKKNNQKYDPKQFIKDIYNLMFDGSKDQATALDYVQHIPKMINISQANDDDVSDHLVDSGVSMDQLIKLRKDFEASIDNVINYLGLNENQELQTALEIVQSSDADSSFTKTEIYTEIEKSDKDIKNENYRKTYVVANDGTLTFIAKPETGLALINQEAQNYGGIKAEQNIVDADTKKKTYYTVVRNINNLIRGMDADDLTLGDVTGIFLRPMPANKVPLEDLYLEQQEYFNTTDKNGTPEEKLNKRETGNEILMVYTDKKGNILYFDENGIPTTKEKGGTIAYATTRKVNTDEKSNKKYIRSVQSATDLSKKPGAESIEELVKKRDSEINILEAMREYTVKNPDDVLLFSITPGKNGYIKEDFSKRNLISGIQLETGFNPFYASINDGPLQKGGVYFTVPDYELPVLIQRPKFSEIPNFVESLSKVLFDSNIPAKKKIEILKQFTYSEDTAAFEKDGNVVIKQNGSTLNTNVAEDRQTFINNLNNQIVNINKNLLGKNFDMPVDGKVETKKYNNFLSDHFYTHLQKNEEGKLVKLNAYNVMQPTMDASEKLFKVEEQPNKEKGSSLEQETATDQDDDAFDKAIAGLDFGLKKTATLSSTATEEQIVAAREWYSNNPLAKYAPFREMFNIVNSDARAMFTKAGVTLFSGSNYTDLYHEGWHVFSQMFLTKADKKKLYGELRNLTGTFTTVKGKTKSFKDASDFEIEEFVAEDFRKYVLSKGRKIIDGRTARNGIFKRIYNFLKALFTGQSIKSYLLNEEATGTLKDLYDKLYLGQLNEYKPSLRNVQFTQLNKGAQELTATEGENKGLNYQDSMVLNETIDYLMASVLQEKGLSVGTLFVNPKIMGPVYAEIKKKLANLSRIGENTAKEYVNNSGGAYGADTFWDIIGREFGVEQHKHYRESTNTNLSQTLKNAGVKAEVLTKEQMDTARAEVEKLLGEKYPDTIEGNLKVRNYYQVANSDAVFAVATLSPTTSPHVLGGTDVAVQLGIKMNKPVYVFDLDTKSWYTQDKDFVEKGFDKTKHEWNYDGWIKTKTPTLTKNFAGVGSRDVESYNVKNKETGKWETRKQYKGLEAEKAAKQAIRDVYENTFGKAENVSKLSPSGSNILEFALNNWGDYNKVSSGEQANGVIAFHKERSKFLSFDEKYSDLTASEQDDVDGEINVDNEDNPLGQSEAENREMFGKDVFERKGNEASIRALASNEVVYLIKSLPRVDKQGKIEYNALGTPKLVDFNRTWGIVINTVVGSVNKSEMYNKLLNASSVFPELKMLAERLQRPMSKVDPKKDNPYIQMWGAFFRDFSMYKIPIKELQLIKTPDGTNGFKYEIRYVESEPTYKQVEKNFITAFQTAPGGKYITKTDGVNYLDLKKVFEDFPTTDSLSNGNNAFLFLRAVGFNLTDNIDVRKNIVRGDVKNHINFIYLRLKDSINFKNIDNPINFLNANRTDGKFSGRNNSTDVKTILEVEGKYSTNYTNNSIVNVDGNLEHDISLNNSVTQLFKELNDPNKKTYQEIVSQPHMAHLNVNTNPAAKYNMLFNSMFDLPITYKEVNASNLGQRKTIAVSGGVQPITINLDNINGIKSILDIVEDATINEGGIKTANLDPNSKFLQDMHTMLEAGVMEFTRRGSKSSAFGASVTSIDSGYNEHAGGDVTAKHLYISSGHFFTKTTSGNNKVIDGYDFAVEIIKEQIAAEMERIAILKDDIKNNGILSKIPGFNKRGLSFTIFDDILSKGLKKDLIDAADANNSYQVVIKPEFKDRIHKDVVSYLEKTVKENMDFFNEMPYLSDQLKATLNRLGKAAGISGDITIGEGKDAAVRSFTVNALIHNMQLIGLVDGDLAMYNHDKEEYNKRNAAVTSTGRIFSADKSDFIFINNLRGGKTYANKIGAPKRDFTGVLNTAVFKDNEIGSIYYTEYFNALMDTKKYTEEQARKILKNYSEGKMNEGDAQGWITFDAYRELALLEGNAWTPKQDELYGKIIAGEEIDPAEIAQFFPPRKYQYAGPLQTDKLHIQAFHKYSLVPLIPTVIKGKNMQTLHDNLVMQGFDYALFESGSKMATMTKTGTPEGLYTDKSTRTIDKWDGKEESKYANNPIFIQYLKNQVDIAPKWKNKSIFSTQLRKLIINDLFKQGISRNSDFDGLVNEFEGLLTTLQSYKRQELLEEIGWTKNEKGEPVGDKRKLVEFVRKEIARQDFADHDIEFIDLDVNNIDLKNDLSLSLNAEKIEKLLNSVVIKRLVKQKMNGEQLVQVSGAGFETSSRSAFSKASEEDILKYRGTNDLPAYRPGKGKKGATTAMKVKIAMKGDYYKLLELEDNDGRRIGTIDRLNAMLKSDKWLDKDDNRKLVTMVGVRIPVQGLNSMEFMEIYEFLPEEAGNILIPPAEIVAKSGSDFDIDKLTIFQPNYSSSKKYASYSKGENAKGTENRVIEVIRKILEHKDNFDALIRPNDTDIVKGTADKLAQFNIQGYDPMANKSQEKRTIEKNGKTVNVISPTRSIEQRYNLYKHESNNVGKKTLGIGAVDNSYSSIFKRIGAHLEATYTYRTVNKKTKPHDRDVNIAMEHNSVIKNGKKYISLSDINTTTMDKVSDIISQLMNGWVDVEKDAWIFNINGNDVAGPVLLFLLEAGVDFKTAAYFVSQPLIIDYIKERSRAQSPFYQASDTGVLNSRTANSKPKGQKGLDKYNIRKEFIRQYVGDIPVNPKTGREMFSAQSMYFDFIKPQTAGTTFTPQELLKNIESQDRDSDTSMRTLMHFFELEDMMRDLTNVKLTMNVDTKPSKTFFDAQAKIVAIEGLRKTNIVSQDLLKNIKTKSPIASFFTQGFQLGLFKPMMKIRADKMVNDFLIDTIENDDYEILESTFKDEPEKFVTAFKNDIPLFMLQNYVKGIDLTTMKEYKSLTLDKTIPIEKVNQINYGAFVKDGVMYIDPVQINNDFDTKAYAGEGYTKLGLHPVNPGTFSMAGNRQMDIQEYSHFVLERETLRANALAAMKASQTSTVTEEGTQVRVKNPEQIYPLGSKQDIEGFNKFVSESGQAAEGGKPKGEMVKDGIYVNQEGLTKEEQLELFAFLKPILEKQALRSNAGKFAPKMVGLELNWDYVNGSTKRKDKGYNRIDVKDPLRPNNTYGWFEQSATGLPLEKMSARFKELMSKAVGIDVSDYDGSIVNIYNDDSFIGNHPDIDESKTAAKYPVVVANIGGTGNIVLGTNKDKSSVDLKSGAGYLFGFQGKNRTIPHSTYASSTNGFLPALTTEIDGETYPAGSYRISITMRRVKPLTAGMPSEPAVLSQKGQADKSPLVEKQSRASFEKQIAEQALINTYNFYTLLKSPSSNVNLFVGAATKYAKQLTENYAIFEQVVPDKGFKDKGIKTLKLKSGKLDKDMINILHENLIRLSDPDTVKLKDPRSNAELSRFFGRLIISEYLRSGMSKSNDTLSSILPTDNLMQLLKEPMQKGINEQMIAEYAQLFKSSWASNKKKTRNKFRNYIKPKTIVEPTSVEIDDYSLVRQNDNGLNVYTSPTGIESTRELIGNNPQYTVLYGDNAQGLNEPKADEFKKGTSLPIPVKPGRNYTNLWTDATYDKDVLDDKGNIVTESNIKLITKALDAIDNAITNGQNVAFPEEGFTTAYERKDVLDSDNKPIKEADGKTTMKRIVPKEILKQTAPRTFEFLATELYRKYGYVHPGAEDMLGFRTIYQQGQPITDQEIEDFIKKCFGE